MTEAPSDPLRTALLVAAIEHLEADGPLDDHAVLARALRAGDSRTQQITARALLLAHGLGLPQELARLRRASSGLALALAVVLALLGLAAAGRVLAPSHQINAVAALASLVGVNLLTLLVWCAAFFWHARGTSAGAPWSFGRWVLAASARLPWLRSPHRGPLLAALAQVLRRGRLTLWAMGAFSHTIWALATLLALLVLLFGFAFQSYALSWQTTILTPEFFTRFVHAVGALPGWLGFPTPSASVVQQTADASAVLNPAAQRAWAWWLIGCVFCWGLLPRVLLAALSLWRLHANLRHLPAVDLQTPAAQRVLQHLDALTRGNTLLDAERAGTRGSAAQPQRPPASGSRLLLGFEWPADAPWPPTGFPAQIPAQRLTGGAEETEALLSRLASAPPAALLVAVRASASPDRGSARFLRQVSARAGARALWLVAEPNTPANAADRWLRWLADQGLDAWQPQQSAAAAAAWLQQQATAEDPPASAAVNAR